MPIAMTYRKGSDIVLEAWVGRISVVEAFEHERDHLQDPDYPHAARVLADLTGAVMSPEIGPSFIAEFTGLYREYPEKMWGTRVAIVATEEWNTAKNYERASELQRLNMSVVVFTNLWTACTWLGIDVEPTKKWIDETRARLLGEGTVVV